MKENKIVILDGYTLNPGDLSWDDFKTLGDVEVYDRTDQSDVSDRISKASYVFTNKTIIDKNVFEECPNLKFIGVLATGYDVVDLDSAKKHGVTVSNVPTYGTDTVAQHMFSLLLEITNQVGHHSNSVKNHEWSQRNEWTYWDHPIKELSKKTLGIIGYGKIGQQVGRIAKAFGMTIIGYDGNNADELQDLFLKSDIISLHCPLTKETRHIINKENINKMKDGVILINNSRGPLINEIDLYEALLSKKIYAAGLDVTDSEPVEDNNPLLKLNNCFITPHISWSSIEARDRIMKESYESLKSFMNNKPINVVA